MMHRAQAELDIVTQQDIDKLKDIVQPNSEIELLMACVMILFGHPTDWDTSLLILNRPHCLKLFQNFDLDAIDQQTVE